MTTTSSTAQSCPAQHTTPMHTVVASLGRIHEVLTGTWEIPELNEANASIRSDSGVLVGANDTSWTFTVVTPVGSFTMQSSSPESFKDALDSFRSLFSTTSYVDPEMMSGCTIYAIHDYDGNDSRMPFPIMADTRRPATLRALCYYLRQRLDQFKADFEFCAEEVRREHAQDAAS